MEIRPFFIHPTPQYTIVNHVARKKLGLTSLEYSIIDSIYYFSNNPRKNVYSTVSKQYIADWLGCSKRTVIKVIAKAIKLGLVEKPDFSHFNMPE